MDFLLWVYICYWGIFFYEGYKADRDLPPDAGPPESLFALAARAVVLATVAFVICIIIAWALGMLLPRRLIGYN